jgi:Cys-tRNA(Pro)/Cys-tRNA(Cys) deacylase
MKTNALRTLDQLKFPYELREYAVDLADLSAESVARKIGLDPPQVFKTLVVRGERTGVSLAVVPANAELDWKALAKLAGDRKMQLVPLKEVQPLTGYVRGGVTALACKKEYPVYLDETAMLFDRISVSAGVRGTQILLHPQHYIAAVHAIAGPIRGAAIPGR